MYVCFLLLVVFFRAEDGIRYRTVTGVQTCALPISPGTGHGARSARLLYRVMDFVTRHNLGDVFAQDTGFRIARNPDTGRAPDVAFVARARLGEIADEGFAELAPDWVAEILSPGDRPGDVLEKVGQWLSAGVRLVWVLDPVRRHTRVYRADGTVSIVGPEEELDGEDVLPGFRCPLSEIL